MLYGMLVTAGWTVAAPARMEVQQVQVVSDDIWGAMNIFAEARGEPFMGQVAVGNVVRERMRLRHFSDGTVAGTVWRPSQFSWTRSDDPQRMRVLVADDETDAWQTAQKAWVESATRRSVPEGTVLYHAHYVTPGWAKRAQFVKRIGAHLFYREKEKTDA